MEAPGAYWLPWDGKGFKDTATAQDAAAKLRRKKTAIVTYEFRVTCYEPTVRAKHE